MHIKINLKQNNSMTEKYKINNQVLIIDIKLLYKINFNSHNINHIYKYVNKVIRKYNIKFKGKKIIIYLNNILIGTLYLTNFYLPKKYTKKNNYYLSFKNSYYEENNYQEILKKINV